MALMFPLIESGHLLCFIFVRQNFNAALARKFGLLWLMCAFKDVICVTITLGLKRKNCCLLWRYACVHLYMLTGVVFEKDFAID